MPEQGDESERNSNEYGSHVPTHAIMTVEQAFTQLTTLVAPEANSMKALDKGINDFEMRKYYAVHTCFDALLSGKGNLETFQLSAKVAWVVPSRQYRAYAIRGYAKEYLSTCKISALQQGKHAKRVSLLSDEDARAATQD